jgi:hypothetical protein
MDEDDPVTLALLEIGRRDEEAHPQAGNAENDSQRGEPRNHLAGERIEALRRSVLEPVDQSIVH